MQAICLWNKYSFSLARQLLIPVLVYTMTLADQILDFQNEKKKK